MNVGLKQLNRFLTHSKLGDYYYEVQGMEIDEGKENPENHFNIEKLNPSWIGTRTALNKRRIHLNRKDWNTHGYDDTFD